MVAGSSYGQIFRSAAFIGGASLITLGLGVIRTKVLAVLLGPAGVGLAGVYTSILSLAATLAGMGLGNSGVRQIAEATATSDEHCVARTVLALRRMALLLGAGGGLLLAALSRSVSHLTFGNDTHTAAIAGLGLAVCFGTVSGGQVALIQGLRRVRDLAQLSIFGALAGTALGLPMVWWLGEAGIVPMLVLVSAASLGLSWFFAHRVPFAAIALSWRDSARVAHAILGLGIAFMASVLVTVAASYIIRLLVVRQLGIEAAGHYAAAYALSGIYAGFILQAMGADFYPRLTAVAADHPTVNRLVNEQTEIALLLAVPGVLATLVFAPWVIHFFYAGGFDPAAAVLRWQVLGVLGRIISWPIGFILLAQGMGKLFVLSEFLANAVHVGLVIVCMPYFGLVGTGIAFFGLYVWVTAFLVAVAWRKTGFHWSALNLQILAWMLPLIAMVFLAQHWLPAPWNWLVQMTAMVGASWFCVKGLLLRVPAQRLGRLRFLKRII
jgi:PST family polysaccharide transporter